MNKVSMSDVSSGAAKQTFEKQADIVSAYSRLAKKLLKKNPQSSFGKKFIGLEAKLDKSGLNPRYLNNTTDNIDTDTANMYAARRSRLMDSLFDYADSRGVPTKNFIDAARINTGYPGVTPVQAYNYHKARGGIKPEVAFKMQSESLPEFQSLLRKIRGKKLTTIQPTQTFGKPESVVDAPEVPGKFLYKATEKLPNEYPSNTPLWFSAHPDVSLGYIRGATGGAPNALLPGTTLGGNKLLQYDISRVKDIRYSPHIGNAHITRSEGLTIEDIISNNVKSKLKKHFGTNDPMSDSPLYEAVLDAGDAAKLNSKEIPISPYTGFPISVLGKHVSTKLTFPSNIDRQLRTFAATTPLTAPGAGIIRDNVAFRHNLAELYGKLVPSTSIMPTIRSAKDGGILNTATNRLI